MKINGKVVYMERIQIKTLRTPDYRFPIRKDVIVGGAKVQEPMNIIRSILQQDKPLAEHVDYSFKLAPTDIFKSVELSTNENSGKLRRISQLWIQYKEAFPQLRVAIGNETGNISVEQMPSGRSISEVFQDVKSALSQLISNGVKTSKGINNVYTMEVSELYKIL